MDIFGKVFWCGAVSFSSGFFGRCFRGCWFVSRAFLRGFLELDRVSVECFAFGVSDGEISIVFGDDFEFFGDRKSVV